MGADHEGRRAKKSTCAARRAVTPAQINGLQDDAGGRRSSASRKAMSRPDLFFLPPTIERAHGPGIECGFEKSLRFGIDGRLAGETRLRARKWQPNVSAMCPSGQIWGSRQGLTAGRRAGKWQPAAHLAPSRGQHGPRGQRIGQLLGEETSSRRCSRHEKMALHEGVWSPHFDGLKV